MSKDRYSAPKNEIEVENNRKNVQIKVAHTKFLIMNRFHPAVNQFSRELTSFFDDNLKEFGLATSYIELVIFVRSHKECSQKMIGEEMGLAPSTITRFISKLAKQDIIQKKKNGQESVITLTKKGDKISAKMEKAYSKAVKSVTAILGEKYLQTTTGLLEHGIQQMEKAQKPEKA